MWPIQTILLPTDFSALSEYAFGLACSLAGTYRARVIVLHVAPPPPPEIIAYHGPGVSPGATDDYRNSLWTSLRRLRPPSPEVSLEHRLAEGDPATEILRTAGESRCDLIVMGTHGRTGLGLLLMGSVTEKVVRQAPCPVLTTRLPRPQDQPAPAPPAEAPGSPPAPAP